MRLISILIILHFIMNAKINEQWGRQREASKGRGWERKLLSTARLPHCGEISYLVGKYPSFILNLSDLLCRSIVLSGKAIVML